jgi:hypothetical protein
MQDPHEIERIYDAWEQTLSEPERESCRRAIKNAINDLDQVGQMSAKELLIALLLFYGKKPGPTEETCPK